MLMPREELHDQPTFPEDAEAVGSSDVAPEVPGLPEVPEVLEPAPPITSRFLFVNVAALRAKQLRRGARPRIQPGELERLGSSKAERVAMEEVKRGLVYYDVPEWAPRQPEPVVEQPRRRRAVR